MLRDDLRRPASGTALDGDGADGDATGYNEFPETRVRGRENHLRAEAEELKQCFTRYAFQSIGLCSIAIAGIVQFMLKEPIVGLSALVVLPIVFSVCRLGTYKYTGSNRALGYELYLSRTRSVPPESCRRWKPDFRNLGWEEAMHAWRVVQPTLYETIYQKQSGAPDRIRHQFRGTRREPAWFMPGVEVVAASSSVWRSGAYLGNMLLCLYLIAGAAIAVLGWTACEFWLLRDYPKAITETPQWLSHTIDSLGVSCGFLIALAFTIIAAAFTIVRARIDQAKSRILGDQLLSIHACAIIWQAVVVAHFTAVELSKRYQLSTAQLIAIVDHLTGGEATDAKSGNAETYVAREQRRRAFAACPDGAGVPGYMFWLGQEAASLASCAGDIQGWIATRGAT